MTATESQLMDRVLASDDPAPRLVYADWLDEQGDGRGELIRIELEVAELAVTSDRYAELRPRRLQLRGDAEGAWLRELGYEPRVYRPLFRTLPESRVERWRLLTEFIDLWYGPLGPADGCPEEEIRAAEDRLGLALPAALREWYALAGRRFDEPRLTLDTLHLSETMDEMSEFVDALVIHHGEDGPDHNPYGIRLAELGAPDPLVEKMGWMRKTYDSTTAFLCHALAHLPPATWYRHLSMDIARVEALLGQSAMDQGTPIGGYLLYEATDVIVSAPPPDWEATFLDVGVRGGSEGALERLPGEIRDGLEAQ